MSLLLFFVFFFFFNDTATTEIYTLSLHDALPIFLDKVKAGELSFAIQETTPLPVSEEYIEATDRKSTRLNSSHANISYAVFCLKKKKKRIHINKSNYIRYSYVSSDSRPVMFSTRY